MSNKRNIIIICFVAAAVYASSLGNGFVWDDAFTVINNDFIKGPLLVKQIFLKPLFYFADPSYIYYRPLQSLSNMFDYFIWGLNPFGFHLTNVLLHICAAILVYVLINTLFADKELSFFTGLLFAVHPVNSSVVNYVTSRADILFFIFTLSSFIVFLGAKNYKSYLSAVGCFVLALFSKETAVIFPLCLIFVKEMNIKLEGAKPERPVRYFWYAVFLAVSAVYIILRVKALGLKSDILPQQEGSLWTSLLTLSASLFDYTRLLFLSADSYMLRTIGIFKPADINIALSIAFLVLIGACVCVLYKVDKKAFLALGFFLVWIIPVGSLSLRNPEYYFQQKAIIEEHWLYPAAIGIFMLMFHLLRKLCSRFGKGFSSALFLLFIACASVITFRENGYWLNNYTIFSRTLKFVDYSFTIYRNMGLVYLSRQEPDKAIDMFYKALNVKQEKKNKLILYRDIANAYYSISQTQKALDAAGKALDIDYNYAPAHASLGLICSKTDPNKAKEEWLMSLDLDSFNEASFNGLLAISVQDGAVFDYLIKKYESASKQENRFEDYKIYRALGMVYLYNGSYPGAISNLIKAVRLNPYDVKTNNALGVYYAQTKNFDNALKFLNIALKLNPFIPEVYKNLATLYNQLAQPEEAVRLLEKAKSAKRI